MLRGFLQVLIGAIPCATGFAALASSAGVTGSTPRLAACEAALCRPDGSRFEWRGITAFALADLVADGREDDAREFVRWAAGHGFTVLRVLAMNHGWMDLPPEAGRRALPRVLALARDHGMYVQVVALAGTSAPTFRGDTFLREQVEAVGALCARADNCVLEIANEPYHATQADLDSPARMRALDGTVPEEVPRAWGAAREHTSDALAGGTFVVAHLRRGGDRWERIARLSDLAVLSRRTGKFVVDNEPIGAAESAEASRRDDDPAAFFAQAAVAGVFGLGATFHCEDCLLATVPGPTQQRCAEAFARGAQFVGGAGDVRRVDPGVAGSPLEAITGAARRRVFVAASKNDAVAVALGPDAERLLQWRPGWQVRDRAAPAPAVHASHAQRVEAARLSPVRAPAMMGHR